MATYVVAGAAFFHYQTRLNSFWDQSTDNEWSLIYLKWSTATDVEDYFVGGKETASDDEGADHQSDSDGIKFNYDAQAWHEVLGVPPTATPTEIKAAYYERIKSYHSDKIANLGQKIRDVAEEESKRINVAFDQAKSAVGFR